MEEEPGGLKRLGNIGLKLRVSTGDVQFGATEYSGNLSLRVMEEKSNLGVLLNRKMTEPVGKRDLKVIYAIGRTG